jgi:hypothetical protein
MLHFEHFVARHGEIAAQAIIENLERFEGIRATCAQSLEERWARLMQNTEQQGLAA